MVKDLPLSTVRARDVDNPKILHHPSPPAGRGLVDAERATLDGLRV